MEETRRDGLPGVGLLVLWILLLLIDIVAFLLFIAVAPWLIFFPIIVFVALMVGVFGFFKCAQ